MDITRFVLRSFHILFPLFFVFGILHAQPLHPLVLNLERAISEALNNNRQILGTVESFTQAQYGVDLAAGEFTLSITPTSEAGYCGGDKGKPDFKIGGGVDFCRKFTTGTILSIVPSIVKTQNHYKTGIHTSIAQPLLRGLGKEYQLSNLRSAQFSLRTAYRNLYIAQVQLILRTIQSLYEVIKIEHSLSLNRESYERIKQFHQAAKLKEKIGLSDSLDVYRVEIELRQAEDTLKGAEERLDEARDTLRDLLALPLDIPLQVDVPIQYRPQTVDLNEAINLALNNRIEIDQAEDDKREGKRLAYIAKKNLLPDLTLVLNYSTIGRHRNFYRSCGRGRENTWGVGVTTTNGIDPFADQIAYQQSLLGIASAERGADQNESTLILEVKKAARQLERAQERIQLQEKQIKTSEGELRLAKIKFDRGLADNFYVLQAEKSLQGAQQNYLSAIIDHIVGEYQLLAAIGLLTDKPSIRN